jgi:hypothetical protein
MQEREGHSAIAIRVSVNDAFYNSIYDIGHKLAAAEATLEDI